MRRSSVQAGGLGKISINLFAHDRKERFDAIGSKSRLMCSIYSWQLSRESTLGMVAAARYPGRMAWEEEDDDKWDPLASERGSELNGKGYG